MKFRKKFYFVDYSEEIKITKRVFNILNKRVDKGEYEFTIGNIIKSLRWGDGVFNYEKPILIKKSDLPKKSIKIKKRRPTRSRDNKVGTVWSSLKRLNLVKLLELENMSNFSIDYNDYDYTLNFKFKIASMKKNNVFDETINSSDFAPIEGTKQILTDDMWGKSHKELKIDYQKYIDSIKEKDILNYTKNINSILKDFEKEWILSYKKMCNHYIKDGIVQYKHINFFTLFDCAYEREECEDVFSDEFIEDRTICCFGFSTNPTGDRKKNDYYMKYDEARKYSDKETDRGHFIAHSIGGDINTNVFPQRRDINRGKSERGVIYRKMEKYLKDNLGTLCFSRPIYFDFSRRPFILEFGYITKDYQLIVEYFENV